MDLPAVFAQDGSNFQFTSQAKERERQSLLIDARSVDVGVAHLQTHDRIHLAPKVRRLFSAYLAADLMRRADFRKAVGYLSHRFRCDPPTIPSLRDDLAAAIAIAQKAADAASANDIDEMIVDREGLSFIDSMLLADACATLALSYRYVVGFYVTDPALSDLGDAAVGLALLAEREHDSVLSRSEGRGARSERSGNAFASDCRLTSNLSIFESPTTGQKQDLTASLGAISQRLKEQILLMA